MPSEKRYVDTHVHTDACDGATPKQVVDAARQENLEAVIITDHQETSGIDRVRAEAEANGTGLEVLPGIEISTMEGFDLLGMLIDHDHTGLNEECRRIQDGRRAREEKIARNLQCFFDTYNIPLIASFEEVLKLTTNGNIAGGHFEKFIYDQLVRMYASDREKYNQTMQSFVDAVNLVNSEDLVFNKSIDIKDRLAVKWVKEELVRAQLIKRRKPCYVPRSLDDCWTVEDAVKVLRDAKGVVIVAHPGGTRMDDKLYSILNIADGLEVFSTKHTPEQNAEYGRMVIDFRRSTGKVLVLTAGSDWHGPEYSPHLTIGRVGALAIGNLLFRPDYEIIDKLREKQKSLYD